MIGCDYLVNAAGPWANKVALMAGIGREDHKNPVMRIKLPVEPRLRSVFVFKCPSGPSDCPLVIDSNVYWRRESDGVFLVGYSPPKVRLINSLAWVNRSLLCTSLRTHCKQRHIREKRMGLAMLVSIT